MDTETIRFTTSLIRSTDSDRSTIRPIVGAVGEITVEGGGKYTIATATTNQLLDMGGVTTASVLFIESSQPISVLMNSGPAVPIATDPNNGFGGSLLLMNTAITSIGVTNNSGNEAKIYLFVAGA